MLTQEFIQEKLTAKFGADVSNFKDNYGILTFDANAAINLKVMKVKASLKLACKDCYFVYRGKILYMRCTSNPRHKRRQGFSTINLF